MNELLGGAKLPKMDALKEKRRALAARKTDGQKNKEQER